MHSRRFASSEMFLKSQAKPIKGYEGLAGVSATSSMSFTGLSVAQMRTSIRAFRTASMLASKARWVILLSTAQESMAAGHWCHSSVVSGCLAT